MSLLKENPRPTTTGPHKGITRTVTKPAGQYGTAVALVILFAAFSVINPGSFMTAGNVITILNQATVPLILVTGMTFVVLLGSVDLSLEGTMAAAGISFVLLSRNSVNGNDFQLAALIIALIIGVLFGLVTGLIHNYLKVPSFILTLGMWYIGLGTATILYGDGATTLEPSPLVNWFGSTVFGLSNSFWIAVGVFCLALVLSKWTKFGRYAYAIGDSQEIAKVAGIKVFRYKTLVFVFSGACAALAGVIGSVKLGAGVVEVGSGQLFFTLTAVVVGGTLLSGGSGGVARSMFAVLLLTVLNNGLVLSGVDPSIQQALFGCVIVIAVVLTALRKRDVLRVVK